MDSGLSVLVAGAEGQVGRQLVRVAEASGDRVIGLGRDGLDLTDPESVRRAIARHQPDVVLNAAAYTAVDRAEEEPERAYAVNRDGAATLAQACAEHGCALVHLSTDYVFDGTKGAPYTERDPASPLGVYGASKAAGEAAIREALDRHAIVRTAWVFSARPPNFVQTILRLARERDTLDVVDDQWGHPTWAGDVASASLDLARQLAAGQTVGTVHFGGVPLATWHGLASAVAEAAGLTTRVRPVSTAAFPRPAPRPPRVELDLSRARDTFGLAIPDWRDRVQEVVAGSLSP